MLKRLKSGTIFDELPAVKAIDALMKGFEGAFVGDATAPEGPGKMRCKRAVLVYEGEFGAMDGPVTVTLDDLQRLHENHNNYLDHMLRISGGAGLQMKDYPPLQLDHSTSALHTVGRLVGYLELGPYIRKDGKEVMALYGNVCVLGAENVEKVDDGRWTHLSVGVDFEAGSFSELTITPFPAAPEASILQALRSRAVRQIGLDKADIIIVEYSQGNYGYEILAKNSRDKIDDGDGFDSIDQAIREAKNVVSTYKRKYLSEGELEEMSKLNSFKVVASGSDWEVVRDQASMGDGGAVYYVAYKKNPRKRIGYYKTQKEAEEAAKNSNLSKGETMNEEQKAKLKKHLMEHKKMSEEDAEKHLAKCSEDETELSKLSAEADESEKLSAEEAEKAKLAAEEEEKKAKLAAEEEAEKAKLAAEEEEKKEMRKKKLSAAKAEITRMSSDFRKASDNARLAARKGSIAVRLSKLRSEAKITPAEIKKMDLDKLASGDDKTIDAVMKVIEDREPVVMLGALGTVKAEDVHKLSKGTRMSQLEMETRANMSLLKKTATGDKLKKMSPEEVNVHIDTTPHVHQELSAECDELCKMTQDEELKKRLKSWMKKCMGSSTEDQMSSGDTEKHLSALAESSKLMQTQFEELQKLAGTLVEE